MDNVTSIQLILKLNSSNDGELIETAKEKKFVCSDELFMVKMSGYSFVLKAFDSNQMYTCIEQSEKQYTSTNCNRIRFLYNSIKCTT